MHGALKCDHIKQLITFTSDYIKRLFQCNEKNIIFDRQNCSRGDAHRRGHEDRRSHRQRPLRRHRTPEVAIRRLE